MRLRADLHIHSCLSPCGDLSSSPKAIARAAVDAGLDLIALTDHNTARNIPAFAAACLEQGIAALYGTEVTTSEEVHVLALFADADAAVDFGDMIYDSLPAVGRDPERFGDQVVVDEDEMIVERLTSYLIGASAFPLAELGTMIHDRGGLFIPAHIDRTAFSVWSQLGFLPPDRYDAVEMVGPPGTRAEPRIRPGRYPVTAASDAHRPEHVGLRWTEFDGDAPGFTALRDALAAGRIVAHAPT